MKHPIRPALPATPGATPPGEVSERIRALEALIDSSLAALRQGPAQPAPAEALLFIGNWHDSLPRLLIYDPILEPVDKIVWAVIRTRADPQRGTAFPSYATIGRLANVGSEATVARALTILRVTRWLTHCGRVRDRHGRFRGNVYVLHDEPLPLVDTLYLDAEYMQAATLATTHRHARVALVAAGVLRSLELDTVQGVDLESADSPAVQRQAALQAINEELPEPPAVYGVRGRLLQQFRNQLVAPDGDQLQILKTADPAASPQILRAGDHLQNLKADQPQNLRAAVVVVGSSNESTTTTSQQKLKTDPESIGVSRWPAALSANHRYLAAMQLRALPIELRQVVLDILGQRLDAVERGAERLHYGPMAYLKTLCTKALAGQLVMPQAVAPPAATPPNTRSSLAAEARSRLEVRLRVARGDLSHWQRVLGLESRPEQQSVIQQLVDQAAQEVGRAEAELAIFEGTGSA